MFTEFTENRSLVHLNIFSNPLYASISSLFFDAEAGDKIK